MSEIIRFITDRANYGWMSNFHYCNITIDGEVWKTVEHYYQAMKVYTWDPRLWDKIKNCSSPVEAKKLGRTMGPDMTSWNSTRVEVMRNALREKFTQRPELRAKLLATGDSLIEEDAPWDSFWGTGKDGKGKNMMGKLLMQLREQLRKEDANA